MTDHAQTQIREWARKRMLAEARLRKIRRLRDQLDSSVAADYDQRNMESCAREIALCDRRIAELDLRRDTF